MGYVCGFHFIAFLVPCKKKKNTHDRGLYSHFTFYGDKTLGLLIFEIVVFYLVQVKCIFSQLITWKQPKSSDSCGERNRRYFHVSHFQSTGVFEFQHCIFMLRYFHQGDKNFLEQQIVT